jgi:histidyl-tRNA synthetase
MFRRERPQKGRYRQFHQLDVEAFGMTSPSIDVEIIEMAVAFLERCGLREYEVVVNSVGDATCRPQYVEVLREVLRANLPRLGPDSQRRTETNPLRVLDSKLPEEQELIASLPKILDYLSPECRDHFDEVKRQLDLLGIRYRVEPRLVRGLDYYVKTTFEVTSTALGAQSSVLGGGRYDGLVKELGGANVPGIGFALGLERLVMILPPPPAKWRCEVLIAPMAPGATHPALLLQRSLRESGWRVLTETEGRSLKSKLKLADKLGARLTLILGDDELQQNVWTVRDMMGSTQESIPADQVLNHVKERLANG